jgi:hypothetical protein
VAGDVACAGSVERIAPPLETNFAKLRLAHLLADAGKLDIEGVEGKQMLAAGSGCEQRGGIAIEVAIPRDGPDGSVSFACLQGFPAPYGTGRLA